MNPHLIQPCRRQSGYTLVEVLVSIVVVAFGLLGVAKLQAAAISNTKLSGSRALVALASGSLVSAMQANRAYWASGSAKGFTASSEKIETGGESLSNVSSDHCASTCSAQAMASTDVQVWLDNLKTHVPGFKQAAITIDNPTDGPVSCRIVVMWSEKTVAINKSTATSSMKEGPAQTAQQSFTLHVEL